MLLCASSEAQYNSRRKTPMDPNRPMQQPTQIPNQPQPQPPQFAQQPPAMPAQPVHPPVMQPGKKKSKKGLILAGMLGIALLGGGGFVAAQQLMNNPARVWERALGNSARAIDTLSETAQSQPEGMKLNGSFSLSTPLAADGTMTSHTFGGNGTASFNAGFAGLRLNGDMRFITTDGADYPDAYIRLTGLESVESLLSGFIPASEAEDIQPITDFLQEANDQWYTVDRTLVASFLEGAGGLEITEQDSLEFMAALRGVFDEYVFTTDSSVSVFDVVEEGVKDDFEGTATYRYRVGLQQENTKDMLRSLKNALRDTKFKDILEDAAAQSYDELFDLESVFEIVDSIDAENSTADVWVEESGKYIRNVRFYTGDYGSTDTSYVDISVPYEGGDTVPLQAKITLAEEGATGTVTFGLDMQPSTNEERLWFDVDVDGAGEDIALKGEINATYTDEQVDVSVPEDAKNIYELIGSLGEVYNDTLDPTLQNELVQPIDPDSLQFDDTEVDVLGDFIDLGELLGVDPPLPSTEL